ncbi:MAG: single-stranded-DNA-specific exonuclease RecJ, partial [Candidatus Aerophobetes bacterium]|nr:single-stranded-DNA-specific exonuclease RecJ [Candidatus Aerophobetes bacterium]
MEKRWIVKPRLNQDFALSLGRKWNLSPLMIQLLYNRGILRAKDERREAKEKIWEFLHPSLSNLHDPFLMKGMERATQRILKAFSQREKILIFGDFDVDGITSTSLLLLFLRDLGIPAYFYIPQREEEGYGLNKSIVEKIAKKGINLIITCDCGTSSVEEVEYAKNLGMDVIVTDHHRVRTPFPSHLTFINPEQPDCPYPFKKLAGVGVAFKLVQALTQKLGPEEIDLQKYLDLIAIGTIADLSPLKDENRILVKCGLERLNNTLNVGLKALISISGLAGKRIKESQVGFILAPKLNACGRLSLAKKGVKLFLSASSSEAGQLAKDLDKENARRRRIQGKMQKEAEKLLSEEKNLIIILSREGWHPGIIGLVASYIKEKYFHPTIIFSRDGKTARGSARSIPEFSIFEALEKCKDLFLSFGGHKMAAG